MMYQMVDLGFLRLSLSLLHLELTLQAPHQPEVVLVKKKT